MNEKEQEIVDAIIERGIIPIDGRINNDTVILVQRAFARFYVKRLKKIIVLISSFGGDANAGLEIYDLLKLYPGEVVGIVVGKAMSAASYILQGCSVRYATPNSWILIHNGSREVDNDVLLDEEKLKDFVMRNTRNRDRIFSILSQATKRPTATIINECKRDQKMDVGQAIEFGLLDNVWSKKLPLDSSEEFK